MRSFYQQMFCQLGGKGHGLRFPGNVVRNRRTSLTEFPKGAEFPEMAEFPEATKHKHCMHVCPLADMEHVTNIASSGRKQQAGNAGKSGRKTSRAAHFQVGDFPASFAPGVSLNFGKHSIARVVTRAGTNPAETGSI